MQPQTDPQAQLLLDLPDSFARLLVHGLAQFHGLHSASVVVDGGKRVLLQRKGTQQQHVQPSQGQPKPSAQQGLPSETGEGVSMCLGMPTAKGVPAVPASAVVATWGHVPPTEGAATASATAAAAVPDAAGGLPGSSTSQGAEWLLRHADITCTDVVMALHELKDGFDMYTLSTYMRTVHGTSSEVHSDDFVM